MFEKCRWPRVSRGHYAPREGEGIKPIDTLLGDARNPLPEFREPNRTPQFCGVGFVPEFSGANGRRNFALVYKSVRNFAGCCLDERREDPGGGRSKKALGILRGLFASVVFLVGASLLLLRPLVYEDLVQLRNRLELLFGARIEVLRPEAFEAAEKAELRRRVAVDAEDSHQFVLVKPIQEE